MQLLFVALITSQLQYVKAAEADLDGDGRPEKISVEQKGRRASVHVGAATLEQEIGEDPVAGFAVIDLDSGDGARELLIESDPDGGDLHHFLVVGYAKGKLSLLGAFGGELPTPPELPGNGTVRIEPWLGFFKTTDKLELSHGKLVRVEQAFFYAGSSGKPKGSPKLFRTPEHKGVVGVLAPGKPVDIIGYLPRKSACKKQEDSPFASCDAFLIRSSSGLVGWIWFEDLDSDSLPWAG